MACNEGLCFLSAEEVFLLSLSCHHGVPASAARGEETAGFESVGGEEDDEEDDEEVVVVVVEFESDEEGENIDEEEEEEEEGLISSTHTEHPRIWMRF